VILAGASLLVYASLRPPQEKHPAYVKVPIL